MPGCNLLLILTTLLVIKLIVLLLKKFGFIKHTEFYVLISILIKSVAQYAVIVSLSALLLLGNAGLLNA